MATAKDIRNRHFQQFSRLEPEEQLAWALSTGHSLWQMMSLDSKKYAERLRNGWKKHLTRSRNSSKSA